jgi:hypothetical protein
VTLRMLTFSAYTFISPTVYISYKLLYASNFCSGIGKTYSQTVLPLTNPSHLSSLVWSAAIDPALGSPRTLAGWRTSSFNIADLNEPVPQSIYEKEPRCQSSFAALSISQQWQDQSSGERLRFSDSYNFTCSRNGPYRPIIAVPPEVTRLDPEWQDCTAWCVLSKSQNGKVLISVLQVWGFV